MDLLTAGLLVVGLFLSKKNVVKQTRGSQEIITRCPPILDPVTKNPIDLKTEKGQKVFQTYLQFYLKDFISKTKDDWNYILPTQLKSELEKGNPNNLFLLDVRRPEDYAKGHIPGTKNIFWLTLMDPLNIAKLPRNREIIVICYVGHTASQTLVLLKLLGFKARVLKFGMGISPQADVKVAGWTNLGFPVARDLI
jgi:rhodanese-related sulfurtransferase